jgi:hypothetical protein
MKINEELKKLAERTDMWREGEYLDLWSVPHFLSGSLLACFLYLLHLDFWLTFLIATVLLILYEVFEHFADIDETVWNRRLDVVVGLTSFTPTFLFIQNWEFINVLYFGLAVGLPDAYLSYLGWYASKKGYIFEQKVIHEFEKRKAKFLEKVRERNKRRQEKIAAKRALKELKKMRKLGLLKQEDLF